MQPFHEVLCALGLSRCDALRQHRGISDCLVLMESPKLHPFSHRDENRSCRMGVFAGDLESLTNHGIQLLFGSGHSGSIGSEFVHPWFSLKAAGVVLARAVL